MDQYHLGILVRYHIHPKMYPPFNSQRFFEILTIFGEKKGIDVTVFSPTSVIWNTNKVVGYRFSRKEHKWKQGTFPLPQLLYDRIAYSNKDQIRAFHPIIQKLVKQKNVTLLGRGLPGKWKVYNMLKDTEFHTTFLPETIQYTATFNWIEKLKEYQSLFFKPASGSHGRGVFRLWQHKHRFYIQGRNSANHVFNRSFAKAKDVNAWISNFIHNRSYIVQPYLQLNTVDGNPFDIRILVQKNKEGVWQETGRAVRVGKKNTLTSNLDGGGTAIDTQKFLEQYYSQEQIKTINEQIGTIVSSLPQLLEEKHGALLELGIDIGVDQQGKVWILEVNSKPGRKSLMIIKNQEAFINSLIAPILYASYVFSQSGGN